MKILILSDWETQYGGAAIAASRLADSFCQLGHHVTRVVGSSDKKAHAWFSYELQPSTLGWAIHRFFPGTAWKAYESWEIRRKLRGLLALIHADVINIHNLHGASNPYGWPIEVVLDCAEAAPVVWTLHDMWSFTGRCAYNYNCLKYLKGCDASCPTPGEYPALEPRQIARSWKRRQNIYLEYPSITAVTPSIWLSKPALSGLWGKHRLEAIPYGIPIEVYKPIDRRLACQALDIPSNGIVLMSAAYNLSDPRKGSDQLLQAIRTMKTRPLTLITMGTATGSVEIDGVQICQLGYIDHERTKVLAYSAADIFVHPSLADNLPNTVMESIACGTPVVSFCVGGTSEMVRPGQTGWLAEEVTSTALATTLDQACLEIAAGLNMRESCRAVAEAEYGDMLQAQRYLLLFQSLMVDK